MSRARRRGLVGIGRFRRLMRRLPDESRDELVATMRRLGPEVHAIVTAEVPQRTGRLRSAFSWRVYPRSIRLAAGILSRALSRDLFYGWILERGRRARIVRARRGDTVYQMRVGAISPYRFDFVLGRGYQRATRMVLPALRSAFVSALRRLARGVGDE